MKTLLKTAGILACAAALGLNLQYAMDGYGIKSGKLIKEVLAQAATAAGNGTNGTNGTGSGACPACPDFNYTEHHVIDSSLSDHNVTSNNSGQVSFTGANGVVSVKGGYEKNKTIAIIVETKNCRRVEECSCCDQRQVGSNIL